MGQAISSLGSSFTGFALPLLVFQLTHSAVNLALNAATGLIPYLLFGLVIGAWVDRVDRKCVMVYTDIGRALIIASIPLFSTLGSLSITWIYVVAFVNSTLTICFDAANFAALPSLVKPGELVVANGRIQASYSVTRILGPLLAGVLLALVPLPMLLLIDALSFLCSVASLLFVAVSFHTGKRRESKSIIADIHEGLHYVVTHPILRWITLLLLIINFIGPTTDIQIVLFAKEWLHANNTQVGLLLSVGSVGVVLFSLLAGKLRKHFPFGILLLGSLLIQALFTIASALTHLYWLTLPFWAVRMGASVLFNINGYSLTQAIVPDELLGRIIIFTRVLTWSTAAIGALLGGVLIERVQSIGLVYIGIGGLFFLTALAFFWTPLGRVKEVDAN